MHSIWPNSEDGNQGQRKDSWMIAWLQKIANNMTALKKWLHKGWKAFKWKSKFHEKIFAIIFLISFEKLILSLRCVLSKL